MTSKDKELPARLRMLARQLQGIANDYEDMKFTTSEEAMAWSMSVVVEDDGSVGIWCGREDCLMMAENSRIDVNPDNFNVVDLLSELISHIEGNKERQQVQE